jgi:phenylalanyl-tRNA synthetase alpha subunit
VGKIKKAAEYEYAEDIISRAEADEKDNVEAAEQEYLGNEEAINKEIKRMKAVREASAEKVSETEQKLLKAQAELDAAKKKIAVLEKKKKVEKLTVSIESQSGTTPTSEVRQEPTTHCHNTDRQKQFPKTNDKVASPLWALESCSESERPFTRKDKKPKHII